MLFNYKVDSVICQQFSTFYFSRQSKKIQLTLRCITCLSL
nr:MAG TPA: hypothetical protein [Caudoviricetes sp.]